MGFSYKVCSEVVLALACFPVPCLYTSSKMNFFNRKKFILKDVELSLSCPRRAFSEPQKLLFCVIGRNLY